MEIQFKFSENEGVAWKVAEENDDWTDILAEVCVQAESLPRLFANAFRLACESGRGPDAVADVGGWRWVATDDDVCKARRRKKEA